jgi:hypothetical protein
LSALKGMGIESYFVEKKDETTLSMLRSRSRHTRCPLARTRRTVVFGEGNEKRSCLLERRLEREDMGASVCGREDYSTR